ncbi:MAG: tetratricopeptide repeat protein, partial [Bacteroidota bacterium]
MPLPLSPTPPPRYFSNTCLAFLCGWWIVLGLVPFHSLRAQTAILDSLSLMREKKAGTVAEVKVLTDLAWYAKEARLYEAAIEYAWQGRHLGDQHDNPKGIANAWNVLGTVYYKNGQYDTALIFHDSAEVVFRQTKDTTGLSASLHNQSMVYGSMGNCLEALAHKKECIQVLKHEEKYLRRLMILRASHVNDLSTCYHYQTVLDLGKPLIKELEESGFEAYTGTVFNAIGVAHIYLGQLDSALVWLEKGRLTSLAMGDSIGANVLLANQGMAYFEAENYQQALSIYIQVGETAKRLQAQDVVDQLNLGLCYAKLGKFSQASALLEPGLAYLEREAILEMLPEAYLAIGETYAGLGDSAMAYSPLLKAFELADSLRTLQRFARIQEMNAQFENE